MKVGKLEREIDSVCKKKSIQFNNKQKSTDGNQFGGECILFYFICIVYLYFYIFTYMWVGQ